MILNTYELSPDAKEIVDLHFDLSGDLRAKKYAPRIMEMARRTQFSLIQLYLDRMDPFTFQRAVNCMAHLQLQLDGEDPPANWFLQQH